MERLVLAVGLAGVALLVALLLRRWRPSPPPARTTYTLPDRLDRRDFDRPDAPWLVAVFTSASCHTCAGVWDKARHLESDAVAVQEIEVSAHRQLHRKYRVEAVPGVVVADAEGVVQGRFLGPVTATDLWATVAELRAPGTLPPHGCDHGARPAS